MLLLFLLIIDHKFLSPAVIAQVASSTAEIKIHTGITTKGAKEALKPCFIHPYFLK